MFAKSPLLVLLETYKLVYVPINVGLSILYLKGSLLCFRKYIILCWVKSLNKERFI